MSEPMDTVYCCHRYTSEQTNEEREYWSAHPVLRITAKRVFTKENGHTIMLDRASLECDGHATRKTWSGGDAYYYTEAGMRAEGGDPATARLDD